MPEKPELSAPTAVAASGLPFSASPPPPSPPTPVIVVSSQVTSRNSRTQSRSPSFRGAASHLQRVLCLCCCVLCAVPGGWWLGLGT